MTKNIAAVNNIIASIIVFWQLSTLSVFAQDIPIGIWRSHISYNSIHTITASQNNVYAASVNGIVIVSKTENNIAVLNKLNGLSSAGISSIAFDNDRKQLLVAYEDGNLDIVTTTGVINYDQLKNSVTISGSKKINHIAIKGNLAYLSADYGVVVFDLNLREVKETFRDLGAGGSTLKINKSTFLGDSIFLATELGVLGGNIIDNLLDFNKWRRFDSGNFSGNIQSIAVHNNMLYAAINASGVYVYSGGIWNLALLSGQTFFDVTSGAANLYITSSTGLWKVDALNDSIQIANEVLVQPLTAYEDGAALWIGDNRNGLIKNNTSGFTQLLPNGPSFSDGHQLYYNSSTSKLYAVSGGYSATLMPANKTEFLNEFENGLWKIKPSYLNKDLVDVEIHNSKIFLASYGYGLQVIDKDKNIVTYDDSNSPLQNIAAGKNARVTALAKAKDGVWVANYGATQSLHFFSDANTWESFSFPIFATRFITDLEIDFFGNVWMVLDPAQGGGILVFKKSSNDYVYLTETVSAGGLPSRSVYSIAIDRDGQVWVGTSQGVAYFPNPGNVFTGSVNAVKPIFSNRFLLRDEKVTSIAIDGGNRKWMGTERGVWLFNPFGEEQVYNFTQSNSPLLSNSIIDIEINSANGEVFFLSDKGVVSFRSGATTSTNTFSNVKIFPNPVTHNFNGQVGISGLATDASVKITDVSGKLVWQTVANGGTATWNVRDYSGRRASTGVYLVFSSSSDGNESVVGKIAIID